MNHCSLRRHFLPPLQNISASRRRYCSIISSRNADPARALGHFNEAVCAPRQRATVTRVTLVGTVFQFHSNFMAGRDRTVSSSRTQRVRRCYVHTCIRAYVHTCIDAAAFCARQSNARYLRHVHDARYIRWGISASTSEEACMNMYLIPSRRPPRAYDTNLVSCMERVK